MTTKTPTVYEIIQKVKSTMSTTKNESTKTQNPVAENVAPTVPLPETIGALIDAVAGVTEAKGVVLSDPPTPKPVVPITGVQHDVPETVDPTLVTILSWHREHDTLSEGKFCAWLRKEIAKRGATHTTMELGCTSVTIPYPDATKKPSTTLFSCHVDTIEDSSTRAPYIAGSLSVTDPVHDAQKQVMYDSLMGEIFLDKKSIGGSLGADDGAGVWLMLEMIAAKVPGTYMFHRGEEVGGRGSRAVLAARQDWLSKFEAAVAFDRAGTTDIITHQGGQRCASDKYGTALAARLNAKGFDYSLSTRGSFTDTKVYSGVIPECINLSVGYYAQHGRAETLNYAHLAALRDALLLIDWDSLPVDRDPKETQYSYGGGEFGYGGSGRRHYGGTDMFPTHSNPTRGWTAADSIKQDMQRTATKKAKGKKRKTGTVQDLFENTPDVPELDCTLDELYDWVEAEPHEAAKHMAELYMALARAKSDARLFQRLSGWGDDPV